MNDRTEIRAAFERRRTFETADALLGGRTVIKVANNSTLERRGPDAIAFRLHATDIITYARNGEISYNTGGWQTVTTKERFNRFGAAGVQIWSERRVWYVTIDADWEEKRLYFEGMTFAPGPHGYALVNPRDETADKAEISARRKLERRVSAYVRGFVAQLEEMPDPGAGDCFFCQFQTAGRPMGAAMGDVSHLESHLEENYFVPSLLVNALVARGYGHPGVVFRFPDIASRALRRYLLEKLEGTIAGRPILAG